MTLTGYISRVTSCFIDKRVVEKTDNLCKKLLKTRR